MDARSFSRLLKKVPRQLQTASKGGRQTLLVVYDNTPVKAHTFHLDVMQAMFGRDSVAVSPTLEDGSRRISAPFFGEDKRMAADTNTGVSAVAILDGQLSCPLTLRLYRNPYASVPLDSASFDGLPVTPMIP
jgi:hypothetical protein